MIFIYIIFSLFFLAVSYDYHLQTGTGKIVSKEAVVTAAIFWPLFLIRLLADELKDIQENGWTGYEDDKFFG